MARKKKPETVRRTVLSSAGGAGIALLFAAGLFWIALSQLKGFFAGEILALMVIGILGGALNRIFVPENRVTYVFAAVVIVEIIILLQLPLPWSGLWPLMIPANACGVMAGEMIRLGVLSLKSIPEKNINSKGQKMNTDVTALTTDMLRFSEILEIMNISTLARNYANMARTLESEPSDEAVEEVREWVRLTLKGGSGSLGDLYVHKDGEVDAILNPEYEDLLQKLTDFANG